MQENEVYNYLPGVLSPSRSKLTPIAYSPPQNQSRQVKSNENAEGISACISEGIPGPESFLAETPDSLKEYLGEILERAPRKISLGIPKFTLEEF